MLFRKKKTEAQSFDRSELYPVIRSSICTGEKVAGFKHRANGQFTEIMLIRNETDKETFMKIYGICKDELKTEY